MAQSLTRKRSMTVRKARSALTFAREADLEREPDPQGTPPIYPTDKDESQSSLHFPSIYPSKPTSPAKLSIFTSPWALKSTIYCTNQTFFIT